MHAPHRLATRRQTRRGVVAVEMLLLCFVLFTFFLLGVAVYKIRAAGLHAHTDSHKRLFEKSSTFVNTDLILPVLSRASIKKTKLNNPTPADDLKITSLSEKGIESIGESTATVYVGPPILRNSAGNPRTWDVSVQRQAYSIRPAWTWSFFPVVHTQDFLERNKVKSWYTKARKNPLKDSFDSDYKLPGGFTWVGSPPP